MTMKTLTLCVTYHAKPGMRDAFIREVFAGGVLDETRREDGCISYQYFFNAENDDQILLLEKWFSEDHQKAHMKQPHMDILMTIKNRYSKDVTIERFC